MTEIKEKVPGQFAAVVLAGDRTSTDPVALDAGTICKAIAPICNKPMIMRVLDALQESGLISSIVLCGPPKAALVACPELAKRIAKDDIDWIPSEDSPSKSAEAALARVSLDQPVLLTTADHALLDAEIVTTFIQGTIEKNVDATFGLVDYECIKASFPSVKRTVIKLQDAHYCGCNLFAFMTKEGRKLVPFWRNVEQSRKRPWRMVIGLMGLSAILSYLLGRLSLQRVLNRLSGRLDINLAAVVLPYARVGVDVDTAEDRKFVEMILAEDES